MSIHCIPSSCLALPCLSFQFSPGIELSYKPKILREAVVFVSSGNRQREREREILRESSKLR